MGHFRSEPSCGETDWPDSSLATPTGAGALPLPCQQDGDDTMEVTRWPWIGQDPGSDPVIWRWTHRQSPANGLPCVCSGANELHLFLPGAHGKGVFLFSRVCASHLRQAHLTGCHRGPLGAHPRQSWGHGRWQSDSSQAGGVGQESGCWGIGGDDGVGEGVEKPCVRLRREALAWHLQLQHCLPWVCVASLKAWLLAAHSPEPFGLGLLSGTQRGPIDLLPESALSSCVLVLMCCANFPVPAAPPRCPEPSSLAPREGAHLGEGACF